MSRVRLSHFDRAARLRGAERLPQRRQHALPLPQLTTWAKHWSAIGAGLPAEAINVAREDPVNADLLYVGTDRGVYASLDRGKSWRSLQSNLPNVPVHDLVVHPRERELVAGTHGRSAWVLDVLPLQELTPALQSEALKLFPVEIRTPSATGVRARHWVRRDGLPAKPGG